MKKLKVTSLQCHNCGIDFTRRTSQFKESKSKLYFCSRKCKDKLQRIGGCKEITPAHWGTSHLIKRKARTQYRKDLAKIGKKRCSCCLSIKNISDFSKHIGRCKICFNKLVADTINEKKEWAIKYKGGKCFICKLPWNKKLNNSCVFDFHHLSDKEAQWSKMRSFPKQKYISELDKCNLVCSNCHRMIHKKY